MANHCILPGCHTTRYGGEAKKRNTAVYILGINPYARLNKDWQDSLLQFCYKYREKKIVWDIAKKGHAGICEFHFREEDFYFVNDKKRVRPGVMPSVGLPKKQHETPTPKERPVIAKKDLMHKPKYKSKSDLMKAFMSIKRPEWILELNYQTFRFVHIKNSFRRVLDVEEDLSLRLFIDNHLIDWNGPSLPTTDATLCSILHHIECLSICEHRFPNCSVVAPSNCCLHCETKKKEQRKTPTLSRQNDARPLPKKSALKRCSRQRLEATIKARNKENKRLSDEVLAIRKKLREDKQQVSGDISADIQSSFSRALESSDLTPHQKLFWTEQINLLKKKKGAERYHPEVIKLSLSLYSKSPSAYNDLRQVLTLPCKQTLLDFRSDPTASGFRLNTKLMKTRKKVNADQGNVNCIKRRLPFKPSDERLPKRRRSK